MFVGATMVNHLVLSEIGLLAAGHRTFIRLVPCMSPHMVISVSNHRKLFLAYRTTIWFLFSVLAIVNLRILMSVC